MTMATETVARIREAQQLPVVVTTINAMSAQLARLTAADTQLRTDLDELKRALETLSPRVIDLLQDRPEIRCSLCHRHLAGPESQPIWRQIHVVCSDCLPGFVDRIGDTEETAHRLVQITVTNTTTTEPVA